MSVYVVNVHAKTTAGKRERATYKIRTGGDPESVRRMALGEFMLYEYQHQNRFMKIISVVIKEVEHED